MILTIHQGGDLWISDLATKTAKFASDGTSLGITINRATYSLRASGNGSIHLQGTGTNENERFSSQGDPYFPPDVLSGVSEATDMSTLNGSASAHYIGKNASLEYRFDNFVLGSVSLSSFGAVAYD